MSGNPRPFSVKAYDREGQPVYRIDVRSRELLKQEVLDAFTNLGGVHVASFMVFLRSATLPTPAAADSPEGREAGSTVAGSDSTPGGAEADCQQADAGT